MAGTGSLRSKTVNHVSGTDLGSGQDLACQLPGFRFRILRRGCGPGRAGAKSVLTETVNDVSGMNCKPCLRYEPIQTGWNTAIDVIETHIQDATGASRELWSACALGADYVSKTSKVFIASFSENADDLSQWRAYCPNGGYSIAFAIARALQPAALGVGALLVPCLYEESLRLKCLDRLLSSWSAHFTGAALNHPHKDYGELITEVAAHIMTDLANLAVFFKHEAFAAEHEVRLVLVEHEPSAPRILIQHRVVGAELIPYVAIPLESEDSPMILEHVIVAPGNNADAAAASAKSLPAGLQREVGVELSKIPCRARH